MFLIFAVLLCHSAMLSGKRGIFFIIANHVHVAHVVGLTASTFNVKQDNEEETLQDFEMMCLRRVGMMRLDRVGNREVRKALEQCWTW